MVRDLIPETWWHDHAERYAHDLDDAMLAALNGNHKPWTALRARIQNDYAERVTVPEMTRRGMPESWRRSFVTLPATARMSLYRQWDATDEALATATVEDAS